jgi:16S rRNA (adenine1518-N6/adenine1519-N6)-dimethyltransferase
MVLLGARRTRALLERHGLHPKTSIGQHFVTDPNTVRKVVSLAGVAPGDRVIEVGPGLGALTLALLDAGAEVVAVETDRRLEPVLAEVVPGVRIVWADALRVDPRRLAADGAILVANLPYQIATPLIAEWLVRAPRIRSYTVMVQKEVGERLAAAPGTEAYGGVSAKVALLADARIVGRVSRRVFYPMPEVESVIVRIDRLDRPRVGGGRARIFDVIEAGFAQRRKTIRRALRSAGWSTADVTSALERADIPPAARAETLSVHELGALARALPVR